MSAQFLVLWALVGSIGLSAMLLLRWKRIDGRLPLDDLPVMFVLILTLYTVLPPLFWLLQGGQYLSILNGRLYWMQPTLSEQTYLALLGFLVVIGVVGAHAFHRATPFETEVKMVPKKIIVVCVAIVAFQFVLINGLRFTGIIRRSESYIDSYLVIQELPLLLRQLIKVLGGLAFFSKLTILVYLFQRWETHRAWIYGYVLFIVFSVDPTAGRSAAFIPLFACIILWNRFVKRITVSQLMMIGFVGIVAFTALGAYRGFRGQGVGKVAFSDIGTGEFDGLWANAVELLRAREAGDRPPTKLFFSELYGPIPSNILPFEKLDYSTWYLDKFYPDYKAEGGGFMFGLISQVAIGFGAVEAVVRGLLVGLVLISLTKYLKRFTRWWHYPVLLYSAVLTFQLVRDSSFALLSPFIQVVLTSVVAINALAVLVPSSKDIAVSGGVGLPVTAGS